MNADILTPEIDYTHAIQPRAIAVLAHGAGAGMHHEFMAKVSELLAQHGITVARFNFPYMIKREQDGKRRPPDRMPTLLGCYYQVLKQVALNNKGKLPVFVGGKSMGSRVAAIINSTEPQTLHANYLDNNCLDTKDDETYALETFREQINGVFCFGYPFHPPKKPDNLRLAPLAEVTKPVLILQGDRDALGNKEEISGYSMADKVNCYYLPDGDHDLKPRVKSGYTHDQNISSAVAQLVSFINEAR